MLCNQGSPVEGIILTCVIDIQCAGIGWWRFKFRVVRNTAQKDFLLTNSEAHSPTGTFFANTVSEYRILWDWTHGIPYLGKQMNQLFWVQRSCAFIKECTGTFPGYCISIIYTQCSVTNVTLELPHMNFSRPRRGQWQCSVLPAASPSWSWCSAWNRHGSNWGCFVARWALVTNKFCVRKCSYQSV